MTTATITETKAHLSKMLAEIETSGKEVIIRRGKRPIAKLIPLNYSPKKRILGGYEGKIWISPDFDEELEEVNVLFSGDANEIPA